MAMQSFTKTKASTIAKIAALPRYRHPMDLLNEPKLPYSLQKSQIDGSVPLESGQYLTPQHFQLCRSSSSLRLQYRQTAQVTKRIDIAEQQYGLWNAYLQRWLTQPQTHLGDQQKQQIYQAMMTAKERNEQRLALNRFIKFGYEYSQAFKVDIPLNPVVLMRMVHPHFGYLNNIPNLSQFKYTHDQLFDFIQQFIAVSIIREKGYTLHSSQLMSFVFWKTLTIGKPQVSGSKFVELMKVFKFNKLTEENFKEQLSYSIKKGEIVEKGGNLVRFDLFRQIFLDKDL